MPRRYAALLSILTLAACDEPKPRGDAAAAKPPAAAPAPTGQVPSGPSSAGLLKLPEMAGFSVDRIGTANDPINRQPAESELGEGLAIDGFGFDPVAKLPGRGVDVVVDGLAYPATYGHGRADVAAYFKTPALDPVGFTVTLPPAAAPAGAHTVVVRVIAADGRGYFESPPVAFATR
ncbi:hypothetical protein [Phenylobacterium sp.]|uniref:hypothetical protein n=1 Tax=Phenylobacterium sp. TaxID=1871053 RepID=UPI0037836D53